MGQAREVMDRMTQAALREDEDAVAACYAEDAVLVTPDQGEVRGRRAIAEYLRSLAGPLSDADYEYLAKHEAGDVAIDEGYITGTHTGPLPLPGGETAEPTGRSVRVRECDVATVEGGVITTHRMYFDQLEMLGQLGLLPQAGGGAGG
ncbi:ester cyclase [Georgenia sp. AZ-5]|uniref:ester cyclase n=1 Tax=Georgenia sp. AZ-5 TaxID=3367526 RepID=UPI00375443EE